MANTTATRTAAAPPFEGGNQPRHHQAYTVATEQRPSQPFWEATFSDPIAVFTLALVAITAALALFTGFLWWVTYRLSKDARESGRTQAKKMERSIEEAAKAASAMEDVAKSMAINAAEIVRSVTISDGIATVQRDFGTMQMRAYVSVLIGSGFYQDRNLSFQADPLLLNSGNTPAHHVRWKIAADVLPVPLPDEFRYPLPKEWSGGNVVDPQQSGSMSAVVPRRIPDDEAANVKNGTGTAGLYVWGVIEYRDVFKRRRLRTFAQHIFWVPAELDSSGEPIRWQIRGLYLPAHNRSS